MIGDSSLALVDTITMKAKVVPEFFSLKTEKSSPLSIISCKTDWKALGLTYINNESYFSFVRLNGGSIIRKQTEKVIGSRKTVLCLENSIDTKLFFGGGGTDFEIEKSTAMLFAIGFDESMEVISEIELNFDESDEDGESFAVFSIKRLEGRDTMIAGVHRGIFVVEWTGSHFEIIRTMNFLHSCKKFGFLGFRFYQ